MMLMSRQKQGCDSLPGHTGVGNVDYLKSGYVD